MDISPHRSDFVNANGIQLHYLDWGGNGDVLMFLAGMGCNAHIFDHFAPQFADNFRVIALTRRGHGKSEHPETDYGIDMLTEDIRTFMDAMRFEKVILAGHSMAAIELSRFAALYPERVLKLIYLDAAYDRSSTSWKNLREKNPWNNIQPPGMFETIENPWTREKIEQFRQNGLYAKIVEIPGGHHYCFIAQEEFVLRKMRKFLLR